MIASLVMLLGTPLTRRSARLVIMTFAVTCALCATAQPQPDQPRYGPARPNVILIMTDDQPAELTTLMPTVARELAAKGVGFSEAFTTNTLCCPARTSVLRGQYVHNHGVRSNGGPEGGFPKLHQSGLEASTLVTWLQDAGYRTALMGKYLNAYPFGPARQNPPNYRPPRRSYIPPGWDEWFGFFDVPKDPHNLPYGMYDYRVNHNGVAVRYGARARDYQTDVLARQATAFIRRQARRDAPFFLYLAPTAPHLPAIAAPRHQGLLGLLRAPRTPAFNEADLSDKPRWLQGAPALSAADITELDATYRGQAEMLLAVDEMVAALITTLTQIGEFDNTYLIFTSDHGWHSGDHRLSNMKLTPYAAAARIPLIMRGPGIPEGETLNSLVLNTDIAPTIAALTGAELPAFVDGRSLTPLWSEQPQRWRQSSLIEFWPRRTLEDYDVEHPNTRISVPQYRAVRTLRHLYVEYTYPDGSTEGEFYDLERDPYELENLYSRTDPKRLRRFAAHAARLGACRAQSCRDAEDAAPDGL